MRKQIQELAKKASDNFQERNPFQNDSFISLVDGLTMTQQMPLAEVWYTAYDVTTLNRPVLFD